MATITIKKTRTDKKDKKGRRLIIVEKQYELAPELFNEVMQYVAPTVEKHLIKMGIEKLHAMYIDCFNKRLTNIKNPKTGFTAEERKMMLLKPIMKFHFKNDITKNYPNLGVKRVIEKKTINLFTSRFQVGDRVIYRHPGSALNLQGGVIIKISETRYHIQLYAKNEIDYYESPPDAPSRFSKTIYTWEDKIEDKIVRTTHGFYKVHNYTFEEWRDF